MKHYKSTQVSARGIGWNGAGLVTHSDTIEGVRREIDAANERAVSLGYKAEQFLITWTETNTYYDDNDRFLKRESVEEVVETYPEQI